MGLETKYQNLFLKEQNSQELILNEFENRTLKKDKRIAKFLGLEKPGIVGHVWIDRTEKSKRIASIGGREAICRNGN